ncbi:MAG: phytoene desaturase family protein [Polyangiales bacterium]
MVTAARKVVVIGGGVGGLVAAAHLAAGGARVTLLERAPSVGGKMRVVEVDGRGIDAGPTVLTMRATLDEVFARAGRAIDDYVTLKPSSLLARHAWADGSRLDLWADLERSVEAVGDFAGAAEARGYREFSAYARRIHEAVEGPFMRAQRPTVRSVVREQGLKGLASLARIDGARAMWKALAGYFRDPRLLQLFGRYATYAGSSPWLAPATLNVIAHVEREGVWLPDGGMSAVAKALERLCRELGVELRCGAEVAEVKVERGRVTGARLASGERFEADAVVMNGDVGALASGMFGAAAREAWSVDRRAGRSLSAMTVAAVARHAGFPLARHTVFFSRDYAREFDEIFARESLPSEPTVYVCAQDRDDLGALEGAAEGDRERLFMIVNAPARGGRRPFSSEEIARCESQTRAHLTRLGWDVDWADARSVTTTPDDFERMFPATGGALYGPPSHGWRSATLRAPSRSRVPGLYLCGGSAHPGAGVPMVARSGMLAAQSALADLAST